MRIAVIGAGLAGLTAARTLAAGGHAVTVFEKSRGYGGRMSTRRSPPWVFNHGAQYFTVRDPAFQPAVRAWLEEGVVTEWRGPVVDLRAGERRVRPAGDPRYVAPQGMSSIARHVARGLDVRFESRVEALAREDDRWTVHCDDRFEIVLVATPAPQAVPLLSVAPALAAAAREVRMEPCLALMVAFPEVADPGFGGAFVEDSPLAWVAHRDGCWVLHVTPAWSTAHFEDPESALTRTLLLALESALDASLPEPAHASLHRWRYAKTAAPLGRPSLWDERLGLGACGDWCLGARVESAFLSGLDLAGRAAQAVSEPPGSRECGIGNGSVGDGTEGAARDRSQDRAPRSSAGLESQGR